MTSSEAPRNVSTTKMERQPLTIGGTDVLAFRDEAGAYYLHLAQVGKLVGKTANDIETFLILEARKSVSHKFDIRAMRAAYRRRAESPNTDSAVSHKWDTTKFVENSPNQFSRILPIETVTLFILDQAYAGIHPTIATRGRHEAIIRNILRR